MIRLIILFVALFMMPFSTSARQDGDTLRIAHICDPQVGFGPEGLEADLAAFERVVENVNALAPDLALIAGDMVNVPDSAHIEPFLAAASKLRMPLVYTPGNHDLPAPVTAEGLEIYRKAFGPDFSVTTAKGRTVISFNTQLFGDISSAAAAMQRSRLNRAVEAAAGQDGGVILLSHVPPFVADVAEKDEYFNLPQAVRRAMLDHFAANGVFLWLCGHTHKTHRNDYGPIAILNGENTSCNFDKRPKGFRLLTIYPDNTFDWEFIAN